MCSKAIGMIAVHILFARIDQDGVLCMVLHAVQHDGAARQVDHHMIRVTLTK